MAVSLPDKHSDLDLSSDSLDRSYDIINDEETGIAIGSTIVCRVCATYGCNTNDFLEQRLKLSSFNHDSLVGIEHCCASRCYWDNRFVTPAFVFASKFKNGFYGNK